MRIIAHLDMDAFFAAIEERDKPRLRGLPIVVGADPEDGRGRGVVSTANYKAREYGIRSAQPISKAWQLAKEGEKGGKPAVVFVGGNWRTYAKVSQEIMELLDSYVAEIEQASVDEAYLDLSFTGSFEAAEALCRRIKQVILAEKSLTASIGVAPNKLVAKIASDRQKPNGLTIVRPEEVGDFLAPLPIRTMPGVGPKTETHLARLGVRAIGDARRFSEEEMREMFGKWGGDLYRKVRGLSDSPLVREYEAKSIGEQETFMRDSRDSSFILARLKDLSGQVFRRLKREGFVSFRTVGVIVRFADFETKTRLHTLKAPVDSGSVLEFEAVKLLMPFFDARENPRRKLFRLIGVHVEKLARGLDQEEGLG